MQARLASGSDRRRVRPSRRSSAEVHRAAACNLRRARLAIECAEIADRRADVGVVDVAIDVVRAIVLGCSRRVTASAAGRSPRGRATAAARGLPLESIARRPPLCPISLRSCFFPTKCFELERNFDRDRCNCGITLGGVRNQSDLRRAATKLSQASPLPFAQSKMEMLFKVLKHRRGRKSILWRLTVSDLVGRRDTLSRMCESASANSRSSNCGRATHIAKHKGQARIRNPLFAQVPNLDPRSRIQMHRPVANHNEGIRRNRLNRRTEWKGH